MSTSKARKNKYRPEPFETNRPSEHFLRLHDSLIDSEAYRSLSNQARTIYTHLKRQYKGSFTGDTIKCPYRDIQNAYGMNTTTIKRAFNDLEEKGFIIILHGTKQCKGNLHRTPNEYKFSSAWIEYRRGNTS